MRSIMRHHRPAFGGLFGRLSQWGRGALVVFFLGLGVGLVGSVSSSNAWAAESAFVEGFEDLPLMSGLTQEPDSLTSFDSPYGRIVETYASGSADAIQVRLFYNQTLPQLGWQPVLTKGPALSFRREGEDLSIAITQQNGAVTVRFQSSPH
jgi:hypothetical protein